MSIIMRESRWSSRVDAMRQTSEDAEALAMWRKAMTGKKHVHKADADNISIKPSHGNSRAYTLDRLQRR
jgi:hypothetical protein